MDPLLLRTCCAALVAGLLLSSATGGQAQQFSGEAQAQLEESKRLGNRAVELREQGKLREALPLAKQVLAIRERVLGEEHEATAIALNNVAVLYKELNEYAAAQPYYERALKIRRKLLGNNHTDTATSLNNLGRLLEAQADYAKARPYLEQALQIRTQVLGPNHPDTASSLNNLANNVWLQGDLTTARKYLQQALDINRQRLGTEHPETALILGNLGTLLKEQGDYATARQYYEQALQIRQKALGPEHPDTAITLNNLGMLLEAQADYAAARRYVEQAYEIRKKRLGANHLLTANSLNNLGELAKHQEDYSAARSYLEQSLEIRRKIAGDDHPETALALNNLGLLLQQQGDYSGARTYLEQALDISRKKSGKEHPETATSLNNVAVLLSEMGDDQAARPYHEQAIEIRKKVLGEGHPMLNSSYSNMQLLEARLGSWRAAADFAELCRRGSQRHIASVLPSLSEKEQLAFLGYATGEFHASLSLPLAQPGDKSLALRSAAWLLNGKGVAQESLAARALLTRDAKNPKLAQTVAQLTEVRHQLATMAMQAASPGQEKSRRENLDRLTADEQRLSRQIAAVSSEPTLHEEWMELDALRESIPAGAIFVDLARVRVFPFQAKGAAAKVRPKHYVAWIVPRAGDGDVQVIDLGPAELIEQAVEKAREPFATAGQSDSILRREGEVAAEAAARRNLAAVVDLVWKPIAAALGNAERLILSPDGALWLLPWAALPIDEDKYLLERFTLQYVVSGRDLIRSASNTGPTNPPTVFADPDFDLSTEAIKAATKAVLPDAKFDQNTRGFVGKSTLPKVLRLPNTAVEAQTADEYLSRLSGKKPLAYTGSYALESIAKRVKRPQLLLFATHGFFLPDQPVKDEAPRMTSQPGAVTTRAAPPASADVGLIENPLLRCGLLLAGCNGVSAGGADDGVLTGLEIVGLDLRGTDLVVLSACETAVGKVNSGEGVAGLRQAFQLAGARSVVATLWQVPDRDSALIMNAFYANLADGQPTPDALRNAQLKRIASRREKGGAAHPFFWAAWTLTGN